MFARVTLGLAVSALVLACTGNHAATRDDDTGSAPPRQSIELGLGNAGVGDAGPAINNDAGVSMADAAAIADAAAPHARQSRAITLMAVGDVLFARYLSKKRMRRAYDSGRGPFTHIESLVRGADIAFANVESPVMREPRRLQLHRTLSFRADPEHMHTLAAAGFDVVSLANNHAYDMGTRGPLASQKNVEAAGMQAIGTGRDVERARQPAIVERGGVTVALIAHTVWLKRRNRRNPHSAVAVVHNNKLAELLPEEVRRVRREHRPDFVVVSLHWGIEYEPHPEARQRASAHAIIDAGADIILGHHPHVIQDIESYKHGVIVYSLGNFLFDNAESRQRHTIAFEATLERTPSGRRIAGTRVYPIIADRRTLEPALATGRQYHRWKARLRKLAPEVDIAPPPEASAESTP